MITLKLSMKGSNAMDELRKHSVQYIPFVGSTKHRSPTAFGPMSFAESAGRESGSMAMIAIP